MGIFNIKDTLKLWEDYIVERLTSDMSLSQTKRGYDFYANNNSMMSGIKKIAYIYTLDGTSSSTKIYFKDFLRDAALPGVKVNFIESFEPHKINWQSSRIKTKKNSWRNVMNDRDEVDAFNFNDNQGTMQLDSWKLLSLIYLPVAESRNVELFKFKMLMIVAGERGNAFDESNQKIVERAKSEGLNLNFVRVVDNFREYIQTYSPFTSKTSSFAMKNSGNFLINDELAVRFDPFTQGRIGEKGIIMGLDLYSHFPVMKQFKKRSTDAEIILVTAMTGGGKSFMVKDKILQFCGDDKYRLTIQDIEGFEYLYIAKYVSADQHVEVVNMSRGEGNYFDATEIIVTGNPELDEQAYDLSVNFTEALFGVLLSSLKGNTWVEDIVSDAISLTYSEAGVLREDQSTWANSKGLTYWSIYSKIKEIYLKVKEENNNVSDGINRFRKNEGYLDAYDNVMSKLRRYFEPFEEGGTASSLFRKRISLESIKDAKMVINSFGMAGKDEQSMSSVGMALAQLYSSFIAQIRSLFCKIEGKYNVKVYEEFQRWGKFKGSENTINVAVTGGRKMGDIVFIITNVLKELLETNNFNILDNITSFMIGYIKDDDTRRAICDKLSMPKMKRELDLIALSTDKKSNEDSGNSQFDSMHDKAFVANLDGKTYTTLRVDLPEGIASSLLFKTAVNEDGDLDAHTGQAVLGTKESYDAWDEEIEFDGVLYGSDFDLIYEGDE